MATNKTKKTTKNIKTAKNTKTIPNVKLSTFLAVLKQPQLCGTTTWFKKSKSGSYTAICPVAKAAVKRGFKYRTGQHAITAIARHFNLNLNEVKRFAKDWDQQVMSRLSSLSSEKGRPVRRLTKTLAQSLLRHSTKHAVRMAKILDNPVTVPPVTTSVKS